MDVGFTRNSEARICSSVRYTERQRRNLPVRPRVRRSPEGGLRRFELTENLAFGGNATAYLLQWTGAAYVAQSGTSFEVYDPFSKFNQNCKPTGQDGARGYAQWCWDRRVWEIVQMQHQARWIEFVANGAFATTDASATVDGVTYHDGYQPDTAVTTVYNTDESGGDYKFEGDNNDIGEALYDPANNKYWIIQLECP